MTKLNDMADVGAFIRARRKKLGYTQAELAEMGKALFLLQMLGVDLYAQERS